MEEQVVSIWAGSTGKFDDIEVEDVRDFEAQLLEHLRHNGTVLSTIRDTQLFESETEEELSRILEDVKEDFSALPARKSFFTSSRIRRGSSSVCDANSCVSRRVDRTVRSSLRCASSWAARSL